MVSYGHSHGGYGALKFGSALDASLSVAFSPQWSIDPALVGSFDKRYTRCFRPEWRNGRAILSSDISRRGIVVYDPYDPCDASHVERLASLPRVSTVKVPFSGHETIRLLTESGFSRGLLDLLGRVAPEPRSEEFRLLMRSARGSSPTYRSKQVFQVIDRFAGRPNHFSQILATLPEESQNFARLFQSLINGDNLSAALIMGRMKDRDLFQFGFIRIWSLFRHRGFLEGESRLAACLKVYFRENCFVQLHAVDSLLKLGRSKEAKKELVRITDQFGLDAQAEFINRLSIQISSTEN